jgi:N-acylneuraminate cytidylyltransferase
VNRQLKSNSIVALIPARSGSKGVPNKNIKLLGEFPLIAYSIKAALKSNLIGRVIVSTDSEAYAEIAREFGAEVPFLRPSEISGDTATDLEFFKDTIDWFQVNEGEVPDYFVHLRPTTPFRDPKVIDAALETIVGSDFSALRSAHKMSESSYKTFEIEDHKFKSLCVGSFDIEGSNLARQSFPETYDANGYVDVIRAKMVTQKGLIHGDRVKAYLTDMTYEVDEVSDFDFLEYLIEKTPDLANRLF